MLVYYELLLHAHVIMKKMLHLSGLTLNWASRTSPSVHMISGFLSRLQKLEDCCSPALWCLLRPFSRSAFVFVRPLFFFLLCFWLFVLPASLQSPRLLPSLNSNPPLVQGRLGCSTTGLFVGLGSNACRPEFTCLGFSFIVYLCEC